MRSRIGSGTNLLVSATLFAASMFMVVSAGAKPMDFEYMKDRFDLDSLIQESPGRTVLEDAGQMVKSEKLKEALRLVGAGKYDEAMALVKEVLDQDPGSGPAYEVKGVILVRKGDLDGALDAFGRALDIKPDQYTAYTKIGDIHFARGQVGKAKAAFLEAASINPNDRLTNQRLGLVYEKEGNTELAVEYYEKGLKGAPDGYVGVKVNLAGLYNQAGRYRKTLDLLEGVPNDPRRHPLAHYHLGTAYLGLGRMDEAVSAFTTARDLEPDTERGHLGLGIVYRKMGKHTRSLDELNEVVRIRPNWSTGYFQRGQTLFAMGQAEEALRDIQKAGELSPNPTYARTRRAEILLSLKRYPESIVLLENQVKTGDAGVKTYDLLGSAYQYSGDLGMAEKTYQEMAKKYPDAPFSRYKLGLFYGYSRDYARSVLELEKARTMAPDNYLVLKALAVANVQKGDVSRAIAAASELVDLKPDSVADRFYLASLYQMAGRKNEAIVQYRKVIAGQSNHASALNNLAVLLAENKELAGAEDMARRAASLAPDNGSIMDTFGWILLRRGQNDKALQTLKKAAALSPDNPVILYHLGVAYKKNRNDRAARMSLERALAISKKFNGAVEAMKLLDSL